MAALPPNLHRFARGLLALEAATAKSAAGSGSAAFHVNEKLSRPLSILTGTAGYRSLLSRALAMAGGEVRWLKAVHVDAEGSLEGLDDARMQLSADEIAEGEAVLIARLLGLLATFIGEGLTLRLVQDVWPEMSARDLISEMEKDDG